FIAGSDGVGVDYFLNETLNAGDILDFAIAPNGIDSFDTTVFSASITMTTPLPSSGPMVALIASAASGQPGVTPGGYVSIYGSNFAPAGFVDDWGKSVVNGQLPTTLDGVSVTIGGQPAYVEAVTASQINVLAPSLDSGPVQVAVTTSAGTSPFFSSTSTTLEPAFFAWPASQVVATHLDYSYAVANGTFSFGTTPSKRGDTIVMWATGFGPTSPAAPSGQVTPANLYSVNGVGVAIGGQPAQVVSTALTPGLAGVYQVAIQIPANLPDGDYEVVATVNGISSLASVLISVRR
ncbi:MAG TPA: IPT/TIG domain-containing protein, partial [Bryobacteraceae bacterium]|nr:IPT/TIG domain-containing protein [Bryobacteraceae bacterium]